MRSRRAAPSRRRARAGSVARPSPGSGSWTCRSSSTARARAALRGHAVVPAHDLGELPADAERRVQADHRLLRDQRDLLAADPAQLALGERGEVPPAEAGCCPPRCRPPPGSSPRIDIAVIVFPQPDSPTTPTVSPGSTVKLTSSTTVTVRRRRVEDDAQALDREQRRGGGDRRDRTGARRSRAPRRQRDALRRRGAAPPSVVASRTASPSRPSARIVSAIAMPGGQISHGCSTIAPMPSATIPPQLGAGAATSRLRNARPGLDEQRQRRRSATPAR